MYVALRVRINGDCSIHRLYSAKLKSCRCIKLCTKLTDLVNKEMCCGARAKMWARIRASFCCHSGSIYRKNNKLVMHSIMFLPWIYFNVVLAY